MTCILAAVTQFCWNWGKVRFSDWISKRQFQSCLDKYHNTIIDRLLFKTVQTVQTVQAVQIVQTVQTVYWFDLFWQLRYFSFWIFYNLFITMVFLKQLAWLTWG